MRELKFRVWNIQEKNYEDLMDVIGISPDCKWIYFKEPDEPDTSYIEYVRNNYIIEQYTGLKDKNGKEIYEGDIVKEYDEGLSNVGKIEWDEYNAGFCIVWSECCVDTPEEGHFTVIGNIHENPELLGGEE